MGYEIEGVEAEGGAESGPPLATLLAEADPAKGQALFAKCASCHTANDGGANGIGPNLHGVVGEVIGAGHHGFAFSDALKTHGGNWTFENMDAWLKSPKAFAPGTKMTFAGMGKAEERAAMIVYLNSLGSNLPLPPPPVAGAPAAEAPAEGAAPEATATEAAPAADASAAAPAPAN